MNRIFATVPAILAGCAVSAVLALAGCSEPDPPRENEDMSVTPPGSSAEPEGEVNPPGEDPPPPGAEPDTPGSGEDEPQQPPLAEGELPGLAFEGELVQTPSGLEYVDIVEGTGPAPVTPAAPISAHYTGYLMDGTKFDSSRDRDQPITMPLSQLIAGWTIGFGQWGEGVEPLKVGGTRKLVIPPDLAYGDRGAGDIIPPNATLVFDIELLEVPFEPETIDVPEMLPGDPVGDEPVRTASGLLYFDLIPGDGASPPMPSSMVKVHYTGWLTDGTKFDSSYDRDQPATFPLNRVIAGWTEGVGSMKVGGKRKLVIPANLAYGEMGRPNIPANSTLVFDVELLEIMDG